MAAGSKAHLVRFAVFAIGFGVVIVYIGALIINNGDWRGVLGDGSLYLAAYGLSVAVFGQIVWKLLGYSPPALSQQMMREAGVLLVGAFLITLSTGFAFAQSKPNIEPKPDLQTALGGRHVDSRKGTPAALALAQLEIAARQSDQATEALAAAALVSAVETDAKERTKRARTEHVVAGVILLLLASGVAGRTEYKLS